MRQTGKAWDSKPDLLPKVVQELERGHTCLEKRQSRRQCKKPRGLGRTPGESLDAGDK